MTHLAQRLVSLLVLPLAVTAADPEGHSERIKTGTALFKSTIGPALKTHCLKCHGGEKTRSGFSVVTREAFLKGGDSGAAADLAHPAASRLLKQLRHEEEPHMPLKRPRLDPPLIQAFERWISLEAPYDRPLIEGGVSAGAQLTVTDSDRNFWAFRPLAVVSPPAGPAKTSDIDPFIDAALNEKGLQPNPPAPDRTFIRRAYLDLIGLPPTPAQLAKGLTQSRGELIDELLDSPHYGERWARHWLDAARFAESHGFEQDYDRKHAYHYRDFVIKALNADMPFDQFVRWQLAGDEIAPDNPLALMATGFIGAGAFPTQLTEKEFESARYDELDDIVATVGTSMLGLTLGCARCHDHKYDPVTARDYYGLAAVFTTTIRSEMEVQLDKAGDAAATAAWQRRHDEHTARLAAYEDCPEVQSAFARWLDSEADKQSTNPGWTVLEITEARSDNPATRLTGQPDGSWLATGKAAAKESYTLKAATGPANLRWIRVEALADDSLPRKGPGRAGNGNFALSDLRVSALAMNGKKPAPRPLKLVAARATHEQNPRNLSVAAAIDDQPGKTGWAVDFGGIGRDQAAVFQLETPLESPAGTGLEFRLNFSLNNGHSIGRLRLSASAADDPPVAVGGGQSKAVAEAFAARAGGRLSKRHRAVLFPLFASNDSRWRELHDAVQTSLRTKPAPRTTTVMVSTEGTKPLKHHADGRGFPHFYPETYLLNRGDPNQKKEVMSAGFLQVLMRPGTTAAKWRQEPPAGRRTSHRRHSLANWITDSRDGAGSLLARVIVNRLWHHHFGRGIVATPNDFGLQGAAPTHPQLLEHLAGRLLANGWRLKPLHREIMLSAAYGRSSLPASGPAAVDPDNQWLWRFAPRRLEAEIIRDAMLAVAGQLDPTPFGPGTLDPDHRRRSIYFMIKRSRLVPMMQVFDQPEPLVSQGRRPSTTIAPQALLFMNGGQVVAHATALADRFLKDDPATAVRGIYRSALSREPGSAELRDACAFIAAQAAGYPAADSRRLALADFCQVVLGLNEFVYLQ